MLDHSNPIDASRPTIDNLRDQQGMVHHDIDRLFDHAEAFRRRLLILLDGGQIASVRALISWGLR